MCSGEPAAASSMHFCHIAGTRCMNNVLPVDSGSFRNRFDDHRDIVAPRML
jgi:hypothetical protein